MPEVTIQINGREFSVAHQTSVAAAILQTGHTKIQNVRHRATTGRPLRHGHLLRMPRHHQWQFPRAQLPDTLPTRHEDCHRMKTFDIVIVGAGPAGMAAAIAARKSDASVAVIDDNQTPGGQIWRAGGPFPDFSSSGAQFIPGARVIDGDHARKQLTVETSEVFQIGYSKLILATGARELFLPFPGWTLPGVFGVGGLQALAKSGLSVAGKRIIVAGTGPLLLAVAAYLEQHGARVPLIAEQAGWRSLGAFATALLRHPSKIKQAMDIKKSILRTKYLPNCWVTNVSGTQL